MQVRVLGVACLCLAGFAADVSAQAPGDAKPGDFKQSDMESRIQQVRRMDLWHLARELGRTRRIDRTGQKLLKQRAACLAAISQAELKVVQLQANPAVAHWAQTLTQPDAVAALNQIRRLAAQEKVAQFGRFVVRFGLEQGAMGQYGRLVAHQRAIREGKELLRRIDAKILKHEEGGTVVAGDFEIPTSQPLESLRKLRREVEQLPEPALEEQDTVGNSAKVSTFLDTILGNEQEQP